VPKVTKVEREFMYLRPFIPGSGEYIIIFDRVNSTNPNFGKSWLLHSINEHIIIGETNIGQGIQEYLDKDEVIIQEGDGKLFLKTLLPVNRKIRKIGGSGYEAWVNGRNYPIEDNRANYGEWRIEVKPAIPQTDDVFLHVLYLTDVSTLSMPVVNRIDGTNLIGAQTSNKVVMFSKSGAEIEFGQFTISGTGTFQTFIANLVPNTIYSVTVDGKTVKEYMTTKVGILSFNLNLKGTHSVSIVQRLLGKPGKPIHTDD